MPPDQPSSSTGDNVTSLHGAQVATGQPNAGLVADLESALERAKAGEITGGVFAFLHSDNTASSRITGMVGPSSLLGQWRMAEHDLITVMVAIGRGQR